MTIYRAQVLDTPDDPFTGGALRTDGDAGLRVVDGVITARGPFAEVWPAYAGEDVVDLRRGILLPGLVDTHVHFPQVRTIGALGMPLLDWLEMSALPRRQARPPRTHDKCPSSSWIPHLCRTRRRWFRLHFARLWTRSSRRQARWACG